MAEGNHRLRVLESTRFTTFKRGKSDKCLQYLFMKREAESGGES